jgi:two-component system, OmpR family, response regulator MprA
MSGPALLLVDDDTSIRRMLERTLAAEGYDVTAVGDGGAAMAAVERSMPDLVVLDVAMPGLDGLAVTRRLRGKGLAVPVLLLTARDALAERVAGL